MDFEILELESSIPKIRELLIRKVRRFRAKKEKKIQMMIEKERIKKLTDKPRNIIKKKENPQVIGILEHDLTTRLSLVHSLTLDGYKTEQFEEVKDVIEFLKKNTLELIVCDLTIPMFSNTTNGQKLLFSINENVFIIYFLKMSNEMGKLYMETNDNLPIRVPVIITVDKDKVKLQKEYYYIII